MANTSKGNKPDFHRAMVGQYPLVITLMIHRIIDKSAEPSRELYTSFLERMRQLYDSNKIKGQDQLPDA